MVVTKTSKEAAGKHKRNKDTKSPDEFLAGFASEDRITPVITIKKRVAFLSCK